MRSKPMWMQVQSCKYNSNKSFGAYEDCRLISSTGSSSSNSHQLADIEWSKKTYDELICFNLYVDEKLIKQNIHYNIKGKAGALIKTKSNRFVNSSNISTFKFKKQ